MEKLFADRETLFLFLVFFVPGFVSLKVFDLLVPGDPRDFSKATFDAVAYSCLNFAVLSWFIVQLTHPALPSWAFYLFLLIIFLLAPALWPVLLVWLRKQRITTRLIVNPNPKVWDCVFEQRKSYWVLVHLKDGRRIGGRYSSNSFASNSPAAPEIYLEELWNLDEEGAFTTKVHATNGILILGSEILAVEFKQ